MKYGHPESFLNLDKQIYWMLFMPLSAIFFGFGDVLVVISVTIAALLIIFIVLAVLKKIFLLLIVSHVVLTIYVWWGFVLVMINSAG
jgi:hypothetical protein